MIFRNLAIAAVLLPFAIAPVALAAQTSEHPAPAHQAATLPSAPAAAPAAPSSATPSSAASPATKNDCQGGACDAPQPHITIATPAPAPAPWPLQDRISWAANLILLLIAYVGIMLGLSALRKIERQARAGEAAAQAATETAKTALLYAQAQERAERPWLLVTPEPVPGIPDSFTVVMTNRGRSPAKIVSLADEIVTAKDESHLPAQPAYKREPRAPRDPIILLPGESTGIKSFRRGEVKSVCETADDVRRVEEWEVKIYLFGQVTYTDLRSPDEKQVHETSWCCWYIHGRQKSGMVMAGPHEYNHHT